MTWTDVSACRENLLTTMGQDGLFLEFDLATGALVKSTDYGLTTGTYKGWSSHEGATEFEVYKPVLSPTGDWLLIHKSQGGNRRHQAMSPAQKAWPRYDARRGTLPRRGIAEWENGPLAR